LDQENKTKLNSISNSNSITSKEVSYISMSAIKVLMITEIRSFFFIGEHSKRDFCGNDYQWCV